MKKQSNKHKIGIGLELSQGFGEVKWEWDEAVAEPVWVFKERPQCSIVTYAFTSQENEIKEPSQNSV